MEKVQGHHLLMAGKLSFSNLWIHVFAPRTMYLPYMAKMTNCSVSKAIKWHWEGTMTVQYWRREGNGA